jgi:S1-C subfamily serine protease
VDGLPVPVGGDVITKVDDKPVTNFDELLVYIASKNPGDVLTLTVLRGGQTKELQVTLAPRPANFNPSSPAP